MAKKTGPFDFEKSLAELEELIARMEQGEQTLEQSLQDFEHGIRLTRACQTALREATQKVQILTQKNGEENLQTFSGEEQDA